MNNSGIQSGLVTHHQLQSMNPASFKVMNMRNNIVPNPNPFDVLLFAITLLLLMLLLLLLLM